MSKVKANDEIVCVENLGRKTELTINKAYTVLGVDYSDFKLDGNYISFYENGSIASDGFYKNGLLDGEWKFYSKNGSLERIEKYENGEKIENN